MQKFSLTVPNIQRQGAMSQMQHPKVCQNMLSFEILMRTLHKASVNQARTLCRLQLDRNLLTMHADHHKQTNAT